jgi:hypothetical protein
MTISIQYQYQPGENSRPIDTSDHKSAPCERDHSQGSSSVRCFA